MEQFLEAEAGGLAASSEGRLCMEAEAEEADPLERLVGRRYLGGQEVQQPRQGVASFLAAEEAARVAAAHQDRYA